MKAITAQVMQLINSGKRVVIVSSGAGSCGVAAINKWKKELSNRIIDDAMDSIRSYSKLHEKENRDALDEVMWNSIADIKFNVMKDTLTKKSLFTQIKEALEVKDYARASNLQLELKANMEEIQQLYVRYKKNIY